MQHLDRSPKTYPSLDNSPAVRARVRFLAYHRIKPHVPPLVTRAYSKAVQNGGLLEAACEEYYIKKDYDEKHGSPNASSPKVFIKYFFANTVTGEKSGEMMTMAVLQEDPAAGE